MSFALTKQQYSDGSKDVTRRLGWLKLKAGDHFMGVEKGMGLKPGELIVRLGPSLVIATRREPLLRMIEEPVYGFFEVEREGFPHLSPNQFVDFFCSTHKGCTPETVITRIEFRRVP